jgi:hypothetical protein
MPEANAIRLLSKRREVAAPAGIRSSSWFSNLLGAVEILTDSSDVCHAYPSPSEKKVRSIQLHRRIHDIRRIMALRML